MPSNFTTIIFLFLKKERLNFQNLLNLKTWFGGAKAASIPLINIPMNHLRINAGSRVAR